MTNIGRFRDDVAFDKYLLWVVHMVWTGSDTPLAWARLSVRQMVGAWPDEKHRLELRAPDGGPPPSGFMHLIVRVLKRYMSSAFEGKFDPWPEMLVYASSIVFKASSSETSPALNMVRLKKGSRTIKQRLK